MSSDSEDDCYGNLTAKMQKFKEKFVEDKTETFNLLDDSTEIDEIVKNCPLPAKKEPKSKAKDKVSDLPDVSIGDETAGSKKRITRSSARKNSAGTSGEVKMPPPPSSKRKKKDKGDETNTTSGSNSTANNIDTTSRGGTSGRRGRGRGRSRPSPRRRGRGGRFWMLRHQRDFLEDFFSAIVPSFSGIDTNNPIYSVGNTDEYPDQSDNQRLFSNKDKEKQDEVIMLEDTDLGEENEELSIKVYWQSADFFKFNLRKFQKFTPVFDHFAKKENVSRDKLLLTYNDIVIKPDDTPDSIGYSIVKFIDGGIVTQGVNNLTSRNEEIKDGIKIKFQCQNQKKPYEIAVRPDDKLSLAMMKCSEHFELPLEKLRFEFDGDSISGKCSARDMELEGGECIDVRILS